MTHKIQIGEITSFIKDNIHYIHNLKVAEKKEEKIVIFNITNNEDFIDILKDKEIVFKEYRYMEDFLHPRYPDDTLKGEVIDIIINYTKEQDNIFMKIIILEITEYCFLKEIFSENIITIDKTLLNNISITFNDYSRYYTYKLVEMFLLLLEIYGIKNRKENQDTENFEICILKEDSNTALEIFLEKIQQKLNKEKNEKTRNINPI